MSDTPVDPLSMLAESSSSQHEMFLAHVEAGFTEDQALRLIAYTVAAVGAYGAGGTHE